MVSRLLLLAVMQASLAASAAYANDTSNIMERVEKEQHRSMIEAGILSFDARNLSLLGGLSFYNRTCTEKVAEADIDKVWMTIKSQNVDEKTRQQRAKEYVNGGVKPGHCGGVKAGQRRGCGAGMEMAPIGAISMPAAVLLIRA